MLDWPSFKQKPKPRQSSCPRVVAISWWAASAQPVLEHALAMVYWDSKCFWMLSRCAEDSFLKTEYSMNPCRLRIFLTLSISFSLEPLALALPCLPFLFGAGQGWAAGAPPPTFVRNQRNDSYANPRATIQQRRLTAANRRRQKTRQHVK